LDILETFYFLFTYMKPSPLPTGISRLASMTGIVYGGIAIGTLVGSPVGGALLDISQGVNYRPLQLWAGHIMVVGVILAIVLKFMLNPKLWGRV
jgi:MFS family permease